MGRKKASIINKQCNECQKEFGVPDTKRGRRRQFCSYSCSAKNNRQGKKLSVEHRAKIGESVRGEKNGFYGKKHSQDLKEKLSRERKGKSYEERYGIERAKEIKEKMSKSTSGENNPFYGKKLTDEHRAKVSNNHADMKGENNPMFGQGHKIKGKLNGSWRGGISFGDYGTEFNEELKTKIRKRDKFVCSVCSKNGWVVHHINYVKENNDERNLITVCPSCHGKTNFDRDEWQQYFENLIIERYEKET